MRWSILYALWALRESDFDHRLRMPFKIRLTNGETHGTFRGFFARYVQSLQYHRIKSHPRQRDSSARYGQEKGRRRASRHEKRPARVLPEFAPASRLGAGAQKIRAYSRLCSRLEDD
jgi:hypothetical protein